MVLFSVGAFGDEPNQTNDFGAFVRERDSEIRALLQLKMVRIGLTDKKTQVIAFLDNKAENDPKTCMQFLGHLMWFASAVEGTHGFIRQEAVVACFVQGLFHPDESVRAAALDFLTDDTPSSEYRRYAKQIVAAWPMTRNGDQYIKLLAATRTEEANAFLRRLAADSPLGQRFLPDEVWAKLGDGTRELALIKRFETQTNAAFKGRLALTLGFVGTTNAVVALARELRTPLVVDQPGRYYSVRLKILEALGQAFPESRMFNEDFRQMLETRNFDVEGAGIDMVQERYLDRVEAWCQQQFGIQWQRERPKGPLSESRFNR